MAIWPALAAVAASVFDTVSGSRSARKQMDFQERMSSTAFQRAAADAEAAGLNRVLALGQPASTPGGTAFTPNMGRSVDQALNAASVKQAIEVGKAQEALLKSQENSVKEKLPHEIYALKTGGAKDDAQAGLNNQLGNLAGEQHRGVRLENDKQEVLKGIYDAVGPAANDLFEGIRDFLDLRTNSAKGAKENER